jgi:hypothetical protein
MERAFFGVGREKLNNDRFLLRTAAMTHFARNVSRATHPIAPTIPNIMENGKPAWGIIPKFPLPKPAAYPMPKPTPMQPRMITTLSTFHFTPCPVAMANPVPKSNAASQSTGMSSPSQYAPTSQT